MTTKRKTTPKRGTKVTRQNAFIEALKQTGNITLAVQAAGVTRTQAYRWRDASDEFAARWYEALQAAGEVLEAEARRRAFSGSDTLLIFLLKGIYPEKYRDRYDVRSENKVTVKHDADSLSDDELEAIARGRGVGVTA